MTKKHCPSGQCAPSLVIKRGYFVTKWNHQRVPRYQCRGCGRHFSSHTGRATYRQHRPDLNDRVFQLYASGMTQRRMALVLRVNRKTVVRKFLFAARLARDRHQQKLTQGELTTSHVQFDEMETFEHTRLKPITIAVAVKARTGEILAMRAAPLSYKGPLAGLAFAKYGPRPNQAHVAVREVLASLKHDKRETFLITTDAHPRYPHHIAKQLPHATHRPVKRRLEKRTTQRRNRDDALFTLNYTAAKIRNDLSRMARKTWVTTKKLDRLQAHLDLYLAWNNRYQLAA